LIYYFLDKTNELKGETMLKSLVILINKLLYKIGKIMHKGSSMPGQIALKLDKNILKKLKYPENIIVVTGSNGKTSTTELIYNILKSQNIKVACNTEGSNQTEGVATMILNNCTFTGKIKADALVIESDERYLRHTLKFFKPKYLLITNLYRDQMTRNGHPEHIFNIINEAIEGKEDINLILNADDPLSSLYGFNRKNVTYFGMNKTSISKEYNDSIYDDGKYCPNCKHRLSYDYYNYAHIGSFKCINCGFSRNNPQFAITSYINSEIEINNKSKIKLSLNSIYFAYNLISSYAVASLIKIDEDKIISTLNDYVMKNDRVQSFELGDKKGILLTAKHENSIAYNQSISYVATLNEPCTVIFLVDAVSRKYFTSETSWIWDINFEKINSDNIKKVIIGGKYIHDLVARFTYSQIDMSKVIAEENIEKIVEIAKTESVGTIYLITCFADRMKFLSHTKQLKKE